MAYWEFLLQKEGDRDWLPLETAHVEISEGRYRIIVHSSYCSAPIDIYLTQQPAVATAPKAKTLKRQGHTTENGLMVVIPFTHLTVGSWDVRCVVNAPSVPTTSPREYGVQLQVVAIEPDSDYWDSDLDERLLSEVPPSTAAGANTPVQSAATGSLAEAPLPEPATRISPAATPTKHLLTSPAPTLQDSLALEDLPLRLQLQHQAIVAQHKSSLTLQGQATTFSQVEGLPTDSTLWVQLRDPETSDIVWQESHPLSLEALPSRFNLAIALPDSLAPRLLVGELSLWSRTTPPQVLGIQGFTVTLNLDALLERVASQGEYLETSSFEDAALSGPASTPVSQPREIPFQRIYLPATGLTLPPVIYHPADSKAAGSPSLPPIATQPGQRPPDQPAPASRPTKSLSLPPIGNQLSSQPSPPRTPMDQPASPSLELPSLQRSPHPSSALSAQAQEPATAPPKPPEDDNQKGDNQKDAPPPSQPDFEGRFWSRLSALAHQAQERAANVKAQMEAAGVTTARQQRDALPPEASPQEFTRPSVWNHEVVIYESDHEADETAVIPYGDNQSPAIAPPDAMDSDPLEVIPIPHLKVPDGDLIAGALLPVTISLPQCANRLAVKVWITDIQSRSLVDRPRWLMNLTPTETDEQTALLQLQVPLGSLEVRFEAIAVDLATQRESYKTTLVRSIVPPDLPDADLGSSP